MSALTILAVFDMKNEAITSINSPTLGKGVKGLLSTEKGEDDVTQDATTVPALNSLAESLHEFRSLKSTNETTTNSSDQ